jgi:transcriptional regulator with XRE-family HTH domain
MMNCNKIKKIAQAKGLSMASIAAEMSMTENEFTYALRYKTLRVIDLENIANILGVPPYDFFNHYDIFSGENSGSPIKSKTLIQNRDGNISFNHSDLELKHKYRKLKQQNLFYQEFIKNIMDITAEILVKFVEEYPESKDYLLQQREVKKFLLNVQTMKTINKSEFIFNQDFYRFFENN